MRVKNTKIKLTMSIPVDKPDANGIIYTKESVEKAVSNFNKHLPIVYKENTETDEVVIGATTDSLPIVSWDSENQVCNCTIGGMLFHSGAEIIVNDMTKDGEITDFRIASIGLTI